MLQRQHFQSILNGKRLFLLYHPAIFRQIKKEIQDASFFHSPRKQQPLKVASSFVLRSLKNQYSEHIAKTARTGADPFYSFQATDTLLHRTHSLV
jgi:hypothetical protein